MDHLVDPESKKLINWGIKQIKNKKQLNELLFDIEGELLEYFDRLPMKTIHRLLKKKMSIGAAEHGFPERKTVLIEKRKEFLDSVGWTLCQRYLNHLKEK